MTKKLNSILHRSLFLSLLPLVLGFFDKNSNREIVDMTPNDPLLEVGDTLVLNCTLTANYNGTQNASAIYFVLRNISYTYPTVQVLTERIAQLRLPNVTTDSNGLYRCALPNESFVGLKARQTVHITRRPMRPVLQDCIVYNWMRMNCTWGPNSTAQADYMDSMYFRHYLGWRLSDEDSWTNCSRAQAETCSWRPEEFQMGKVYCIQINATNALPHVVSSDIACVKTQDIVKPGSPTDFRWTKKDRNSVVISWSAPKSSYRYEEPLICQLDVQSKWDKQNFTIYDGAVSKEMHVVPYTDYTVKIRALPSNLGFPSDELVGSFKSPSTEPCANPTTLTNAFYDHSLGDSRKVTLYWQPIAEQDKCGVNLEYEVLGKVPTYSEDDSPQKIKSLGTTKTCSIEVQLPDKGAYEIVLYSRNEIGRAGSVLIVVPSADDLVRDLQVISEGQDKFVWIHWYQVEPSPDVSRYTLFWRLRKLGLDSCEAPIQWLFLDARTSEYNLTLDQDFGEYQIGLAVNYGGMQSSGIIWATPLHSLSAKPEKPKDVKVNPPEGAGSYSELVVTWSLPSCGKDCGHAHSFKIIVCAADDEDKCQGNSESVDVQSEHCWGGTKNHLYTYNLIGLQENSKYKILVMSYTRFGKNATSEAAYGTTAHFWATPGTIAGLVIASLVFITVVIFVLYTAFRCCHKWRKKLTSAVKISLPAPQRVQLPSTSSETPMLTNMFDYNRQQSRLSGISGDSGHCSPTPSSPMMLPLLQKDSLENLERLLNQTDLQNNCYQTTNFNDVPKFSKQLIPEEAPEQHNSSPDCVLSYKIVPEDITKPNSNQKALSNGNISGYTHCNPAQDVAVAGNRGVPYDKGSDVVYTTTVNLLDQPLATETDFGNTSDIGYTKIETLDPFYNHASELHSKKNSIDNKFEGSNLLQQFDSHFDTEEVSSSKLPPVSHIDQLLALYGDSSLIDVHLTDKELLTTCEDHNPEPARMGDEALLHNYHCDNDMTISGPNSNCAQSSLSDGYVDHTILFAVDSVG